MASCYPSPLPDPRSPPPRARCHSQLSAWQQRAQREFQSSPRGARAGGTPLRSRASAGLSLPASLLSTRDHVVITKDSSGLPARNAVATAPTHARSEGEDQDTSSQLAQPNTSPLSCPSVSKQAEPTQGTRLPQALLSPRLCAPAKPQLGLPTDSWADNAGLRLPP